jgi:hypothetical protein
MRDPEHLAPYGTDDKREILSTYKLVARKVKPIFLDVNRRIPLPIAEVVSRISYNGLLNTHPTKIMLIDECCKWSDVQDKEVRDGESKSNPPMRSRPSSSSSRVPSSCSAESDRADLVQKKSDQFNKPVQGRKTQCIRGHCRLLPRPRIPDCHLVLDVHG